jgi:dCMP deaminase
MTKEKRLKLDRFFMQTAKNASEFSHCVSLKVGCVITKNDRIISTGYNGTVSSFINCDEVNFKLDIKNPEDRIKHHSFSEKFEIHSEMNAILDLTKRGMSTDGATVYITTAPCHNCAKLIIAAGILRVVYLNNYDLEKVKDITKNFTPSIVDFFDDGILYEDLSGIDILKLSNIQVEKISL